MTTETTRLPELTGSEKQVAWATDIRATAVNAWETAKAGLIAEETAERGDEVAPGVYQLSPEQIEKIERAIAGTDEFIARQNRASFWIDNRGIEFASIYKKLGRGSHAGIRSMGQMVYPNGGVGPLSQ